MGTNLNRFRVGLGVVVASTLMVATGAANAQPYHQQSVAEEFDSAYFDSTGDFYRATSVRGQFAVILGVGVPWRGLNNFPETQTAQDGLRVHELYRRTMLQQVSNSPIIRTPDLLNPFDTSIMELPAAQTMLPSYSSDGALLTPSSSFGATGATGAGVSGASGVRMAPAGFPIPAGQQFAPGTGATSGQGDAAAPVRGLW